MGINLWRERLWPPLTEQVGLEPTWPRELFEERGERRATILTTSALEEGRAE